MTLKKSKIILHKTIMGSKSGVLKFCGGVLMTPLMYHSYMNTDIVSTHKNMSLKLTTIMGIMMITASLIPEAPQIDEGDTGSQMMFTTLSFCSKSVFTVGIGLSLINYISRH
ncbi:MAG: hypothetical protein WD512_11910 [Candidatus Paceibacterota bacterium]